MQNDSVPNSVTVSGNKTLAAVDSGVVQQITGDAGVITLPAAAAGLVGMTVVIEVAGKPVTNGPAGTGTNKSTGFSVSPAAADGITGGGLATPVVNKDFVYAKATANIGDRLVLICSGVTGTGAWYVREISGSGWTREP